jgi:redox-sensitive bicupin YhaK (pirin superfamily)
MTSARRLTLRSAGKRHGPITRLVSPSDVGQLIKPFVFLDYVDAPGGGGPNFGFHPHSGIATLTYPLSFDAEHEATSGQIDMVRRGGVEWVVAGGGLWHRAHTRSRGRSPKVGLWKSVARGSHANSPYSRKERSPCSFVPSVIVRSCSARLPSTPMNLSSVLISYIPVR